MGYYDRVWSNKHNWGIPQQSVSGRMTMERRPKLLDQVRYFMRLKQYRFSTERDYISCIRQFILYHDKKHPLDMNEVHIQAFLNYLAVERRLSASAQNKALNAISLLYKHILHRPLGDFSASVRAKTPYLLPVVLTSGEVKALLNSMENTQHKLIIRLIGIRNNLFLMRKNIWHYPTESLIQLLSG